MGHDRIFCGANAQLCFLGAERLRLASSLRTGMCIRTVLPYALYLFFFKVSFSIFIKSAIQHLPFAFLYTPFFSSAFFLPSVLSILFYLLPMVLITLVL